jgi:predicted Rossmann fold nucleotide-binding protein DprA/Smf involved in DNA uptake
MNKGLIDEQMSSFLTDDTKAIILLCGVFGKGHSAKTLTQTEYNKLARWLVREKMRPEDLLKHENVDSAAMGSGIAQERLKALLGREVQLGFAVEQWQQNGIWIISRSDKNYLVRYKKHLKDKAPPLIFGVGDRSLLRGGGVAIVGSRNVDADGEAFTRQTAELCAYNRMPVVSGGARGVDQIAMASALDADGIVIGILAENLLKKSLERNARDAISAGRLLLISPYHPNARFAVGTAMGRNKLIYAMADYGLVVSAEHGKGGTWAGTTEELKRDNSLAIFVRSSTNAPTGNKELLDLGVLEWSEVKIREKLNQQLADSAKSMKRNKQKNMSIFDFQEQ